MITMPNSDFDLSQLAVQRQTQAEKSELGQDDFLMLMIEQFRNQDPFAPMENGEFIAQMAQFSQVAGIAEMNDSMKDLAGSIGASQALQASTMVGRSVLADGNVATLGADTPLKGGVELPYGTNAAFVRIFDSQGQPVREISLGSRPAGLATFEWDGLLPDGERAEAGNYLVAAGLRNSGVEEPLGTLVGTRVTSISLTSGGRSAQITTEAGEQLSLSQVRAIM